jgi:hypothetical protein
VVLKVQKLKDTEKDKKRNRIKIKMKVAKKKY